MKTMLLPTDFSPAPTDNTLKQNKMHQNHSCYLDKKPADNAKLIKLMAHIISVLVCGFSVIFLAGIGLPDFTRNGNLELSTFILFVSVAGYVFTWFHESLGAISMLAGGIALIMYNFYYGDINVGFIFGFPFILCAFLFLWHIKRVNETAFQ
jgi:hypothetical protein